MMKRMVSLILALTMVLSLMAGMAVGVGATETEYTYIEGASVTGPAIPELKLGDTLPEMSYSVPEGANYTVQSSWLDEWYDAISAGTVVEDGKVYRLEIKVTANDGYAFSHGYSLLLNGEKCNCIAVNTRGNGFEHYEVNTNYAFLTPIDKVELSCAEPVAGQTLPVPAVPTGVNYTVDYFSWYDYEARQWLGSDVAPETVAERANYRLNVSMAPAEGYMFTEATEVWVNGQKIDVTISRFDYISYNSEVYDLTEPVSKVEVTYAEPEVGKELPMPVAKDASYIVSENTEWYDYETGTYLAAGTVAEEGHQYELCIDIVPAAGYKFTDETALWVNGVQIDAGDVSIDTDNLYYNTQLFDFTRKVSTVAITCAEPVVGQPFPQPVADADAGYTLEYYWVDQYTDYLAEGTVQDGGIYQLQISARTEGGCRFAEKITFTYNGSPVDEFDYYYNETYLSYNHEYSFAKPLDKIEVSYTTPEVGKAPGAITVPAGADYILGEDSGWYDYVTDKKVTGVFESGKRYQLVVELLLDQGYEVTQATEVYVNGKKITNFGVGTASLRVYDFYSFATAIDKVELPAWPELKVGDTLPNIEGTGEHYSYFVDWYGEDTEGNEVEGTTVQEGVLYYAYMRAVPETGYEFTQDTVFTMSGGDLVGWTEMDYSYIKISNIYNFSDLETIDRIELSVSIPRIGQSGGAVTVPADAKYAVNYAMWAAASDETYNDLRYEKVVYQEGDRILLAVNLRTLGDCLFSPDTVVTINGKEYKMLSVYGGLSDVSYMLDLGEVQAAPNYNGLVPVDGVWGYYEGGVLQTDYTGLVPYGDILFYVENGILDFTYTGLVWYNDAWRYVANSQLTEGYTGLVWFNDNWFYTVDSVIDWTFTGLVPYEGNYFYVQNNLLDWSYTGLGYHDGGWYFIQNGLLQKEYSGLVYFNDNWFYVEEGVLTYQYFGMVEYEGNLFYVQASHLDWSYTGLGYHEGAWYYFQNALYTPSFSGLVAFNGSLFYVSSGTVDWTYNGTANYNGVDYEVINGVAVQ